jgi:hypothetical protein
MNEKDKVVAELSDENWPWDLALLCDISHHINDLNTKVQGQQTHFGAVRTFEMKKLFWKQLENAKLCYFSCDLLHEDSLSKCPCCRNDWFLD